ncbi:Nuclear control of ATPase protein 2 [Lecanora helva]
MSLVSDHIGQVDGQLDRLHLSRTNSPEIQTVSDESESYTSSDVSIRSRILQLQAVARGLSTASSVRQVVAPEIILASLRQAGLLESQTSNDGNVSARLSPEQELEWLIVAKAATQTYGLILEIILDHTIPLARDIAYWDEVLGSSRSISLYTIQTFPTRVWEWATDIYHDARERLQFVKQADEDGYGFKAPSLSHRWAQFYDLVKDSIRDRSLIDFQSKALSPLTKSRLDAKSRRSRLKRFREMSASGLGMLMDEAMIFEVNDEVSMSSNGRSNRKDEWQMVVFKSVSLMETILDSVTTLELGTSDFEDTIFRNVEDESGSTQPEDASSQNIQLATRLQTLLDVSIPAHLAANCELNKEYGKPSRLVRYWLPGLALFLSSSTLLRMFVNRKAEIFTWFRDIGTTTIDFWANWVVEPVKKIIGTIRHDKDSEIAIMNKESLQGDRASLERMVVDFAVDNPSTSSGTPLTEAEISEVRAKVKEGDLTPVLKAYEQDLRKPFIGTIKGDLVRALLIQIQKTKVDVEVAVGGIDNLLKSQELVFGFVGLTPGILVCIGLSRWLSSTLIARKGRTQGKKQGGIIRIVRNIDRILSSATTSANGVLSYKDHGMLLCEVHVLREKAQRTLPGEIYHEFLEEIHDLTDVRIGVDRQMHVVERIRWAYSKWLQ